MTDEPRSRGWLSRLAPGVRNWVGRRLTPARLWVRCAETGELIYRPDLEAARWVTPSGFHMRIGPAQRFACTFDGGRFERLPSAKSADDPLGFAYGKPYRESLAAARKTSGEADALAAAVGAIGAVTSVVLVQDFAFVGGSLGVAVGETFVAAAEEALRREAPLVIFTAAAGARMQESALALMQMARTTLAVRMLKDAGLPYVVVLTDPTIGGVTASYAMLGDAHFAEPGAVVGFTGRRVIAQTLRQTLPADYQTAEFLQGRGMVDQVVHRHDLPKVLGSMLATRMRGRDRRTAA